MNIKSLLLGTIILTSFFLHNASAAVDPSPIANFDFKGDLINQAETDYSLISQTESLTFKEDQGLSISGEGIALTLNLKEETPINPDVSILMRVMVTGHEPRWGISLAGEDANHWQLPEFKSTWEHDKSWMYDDELFAGGYSSVYVPSTGNRVQTVDADFVSLPSENQWMTLGFVNGQMWIDGEYYLHSAAYYSSHFYQALDLNLWMGSDNENLFLSHLLVFDELLDGEAQLRLMEKYATAVPEPSTFGLFMMGLFISGIVIRRRI